MGILQDNVGCPFEKVGEVKVRRNQHHPEQQDQRIVIDRTIRALGRHYAG